MPRLSSYVVDPVFAEIAKALYGDDVDPREVQDFAKSGVDGSTVHVDSPVDPAKAARDQKRLAVTGLAATGVAGVAGLHAIKATLNENADRMAEATGIPKKIRRVGALTRLGERTGLKPAKVAAIVGAGALGLHGVELVGDSLGAHAQIRAIKDANNTNPTNPVVSKAFRLKPLNTIRNTVPSLRARRVKMNPMPANPRTQAGVFQPVAKGARAMVRSIGATVRNVEATTTNAASASGHAERAAKEAADSVARVSGHAERAAKEAADSVGRVKRLIPKVRTAALVGGGTAASMVGASYAGSYAAGRHRDGKKLVAKAGPVEVVWTGEIAKVDPDKRQVFGWASVSRVNGEDIVDLQGDIVEIDEIEKSAYQYVLESRKGGDMHQRVSKFDSHDQPLHTADMIESFVVTPEKLEKMGLPEDALPLGWWVGYHVNDDVQWGMVKSGERTGFSIHGKGTRKSVSKGLVSKAAGQHRAVGPRAKTDLTYMPMRSADAGVKRINRVRAQLIRRGPLITGASGFLADMGKAYMPGKAVEIVDAARKAKLTPIQRVMRSDFDMDAYHRQNPENTADAWPTKPMRAAHRATLKDAAKQGHSADEMYHAINGSVTGVPKGFTQRGDIAAALGPQRWARAKAKKWSPPEPMSRDYPLTTRVTKAIAAEKILPQSDNDEHHRVRSGLRLAERAQQAVHPPLVPRHQVTSTAIRSMGYQPQTRRLAYQMRSRDEPYTYRVKPGQARAALSAESKGRYYATQVRGKTKRPEHYTPADRARLFVNPQKEDVT